MPKESRRSFNGMAAMVPCVLLKLSFPLN
jgi:hypothetical protein